LLVPVILPDTPAFPPPVSVLELVTVNAAAVAAAFVFATFKIVPLVNEVEARERPLPVVRVFQFHVWA
jgi:hypothetical protein